jgi:hypothetical protein
MTNSSFFTNDSHWVYICANCLYDYYLSLSSSDDYTHDIFIYSSNANLMSVRYLYQSSRHLFSFVMSHIQILSTRITSWINNSSCVRDQHKLDLNFQKHNTYILLNIVLINNPINIMYGKEHVISLLKFDYGE